MEDTPATPQLSHSQQKRLAAQAYNAERSRPVRITCPKCKEMISIPQDSLVYTNGKWSAPCPKCKTSIRLARLVR